MDTVAFILILFGAIDRNDLSFMKSFRKVFDIKVSVHIVHDRIRLIFSLAFELSYRRGSFG